MTTTSIRPSTLDGIKQLAKKISRERHIRHTLALDEASRQAGFENLVHAKRQLHGAQSARRFAVFLSVHWANRRPSKSEPLPPGPRAGREILCVELSRRLPEIVAKHRVGYGRGLQGFRMEYEDHLEHRTNVEGQSKARELILNAVRSLRFMEATGLQPVSTAKYKGITDTVAKLPGKDHTSNWFDPETLGFVCLDEPYVSAIKRRSSERESWLALHSLKMITPTWEGIYNAGECVPHFISQDSQLLERIAGELAKVQPLVEPEIWPHETGLCNDDFVSPNRLADGKKRRGRPRPSYGDHNGATPYGGAPGIPSRWRPTKAMDFELHQQLGAFIKGLTGGFSWRMAQKLSLIRSDLEDWSLMEHRGKHGDSAYDLYYGSWSGEVGDTDVKRSQMLTAARAIIERGYEDCKPRRELLVVFDSAINEVEKRLANSVLPGLP
jgi:hypothetical protein